MIFGHKFAANSQFVAGCLFLPRVDFALDLFVALFLPVGEDLLDSVCVVEGAHESVVFLVGK